ncbi:MAG TPA: MFS transporter [Chloroflexi bacterium]|nr:MFS transporter [Chloroflexota bacterium]HHW85138.1 MFS transporter [Chloroflexota bacterium]
MTEDSSTVASTATTAGAVRRYPRNIYITTVASLLTDISSEMVVYLLPLFLASVLKTSTPLIGLIEGVAETTAALTKLASGYISDRIGNRKWLAVGGYTLSLVVKPLLATASSWSTVFAARFGDRLGKGIRTAPRDAIIADSIDATRRGAAFGFQRAGDTLGAFIGLAVAIGVVYWSQQRSLELTQATFTMMVWLSMIPAALAVALLAWGLQEQRRATPAPGVARAPVRLSLAAFDPRFRLALLGVAIFTLGNSADAFIVLLAQARGASVLTTLLMVLLFNGVYTVFAQPFGQLSDRIGRLRVIQIGWSFYALVYLGFALSNTVWQIAVLWGLYGLYYAMTEGAIKSLVADLVPGAQRGVGYGWLNGTIGLMALPASLVAGVLWAAIAPTATFLFGALMAGAALLIVMRLRHQSPVT